MCHRLRKQQPAQIVPKDVRRRTSGTDMSRESYVTFTATNHELLDVVAGAWVSSTAGLLVGEGPLGLSWQRAEDG